MREIEFDVGPAQEILAENDGDVRSEFMLARNQHAPVAAHFRTKRKLIDGNRLDGAFAADADHPAAAGIVADKGQPIGGRAQDDAADHAGAGVGHVQRLAGGDSHQRAFARFGGGSASCRQTRDQREQSHPMHRTPVRGQISFGFFSTIWIAAQLHSARCSTSWRSATV